MVLKVEGEQHAIVEGGKVLASARIYRPYDDLLRLHGIVPSPPFPMVLTDLEGSGHAGAMRMLLDHIKEMSRTIPIHACVLESNPKRDHLIERYTEIGCVKTMTMMVLNLEKE